MHQPQHLPKKRRVWLRGMGTHGVIMHLEHEGWLDLTFTLKKQHAFFTSRTMIEQSLSMNVKQCLLPRKTERSQDIYLDVQGISRKRVIRTYCITRILSGNHRSNVTCCSARVRRVLERDEVIMVEIHVSNHPHEASCHTKNLCSLVQWTWVAVGEVESAFALWFRKGWLGKYNMK